MAVISHFQAKVLLKARQQGQNTAKTSIDLGMTTTEAALDSEGVLLPGDLRLSWAQLEDIQDEENSCFAVEPDGELRKIQAFSDVTHRQCSLMPTSGPPTLILAGFPMHRIKDTDPAKDTRSKIKSLGRVQGKVLDTNTGLGYTAIALSQYADHVTTVELDPAVLEIARENPWSRDLFDNPKITQVVGDSFDLVEDSADESYDRVLHDPPTFQLAGELYSADFYREVWRILHRSGRMFHYIGDPNSGHGARVTRGVVKRLGEAGFKRVQPRPGAFGVLAYK